MIHVKSADKRSKRHGTSCLGAPLQRSSGSCSRCRQTTSTLWRIFTCLHALKTFRQHTLMALSPYVAGSYGREGMSLYSKGKRWQWDASWVYAAMKRNFGAAGCRWRQEAQLTSGVHCLQQSWTKALVLINLICNKFQVSEQWSSTMM